MADKIRSQLSASFSSSAVIPTIVLVLLVSSVIFTNAGSAQIFPNTKDNNNTTTPEPTPPSTLQQQQQQPNQPKLHLVKITSPIKGQQVLIGKDLAIFGTSVANTTTSDCKVAIIVNGIKPYHDASASTRPGQTDYSKWNFTLTSAYTAIKPGQNKITAKFSCSNNPILMSHNSVNVSGVTHTDVVPINNNSSSQKQRISSSITSPSIEGLNSTTASSTSTPATLPTSTSPVFSDAAAYSAHVNDYNLRPLLVSLHLGKNSLHPGDKQTIILSVDDKNSSAAISGASVSGKITGPSGVVKKVEGTTDDKGKASYSWKVHNDYATGKYKVKIHVSASGYDNYSGSKTFKVTPIPVTVSNDNSIKSHSDSTPASIIIPSDNLIPQTTSAVTIHHSSASSSDNTNTHHHVRHNHPSTIISSTSHDTISNHLLIPQSTPLSTDTNADSDSNRLHHPSTIIPSKSDNTEGNTNSNTNTNTNNDLQSRTSIGAEKSNDVNSHSLSSSSSTSAGSNLGIHVGSLAQKIINDVKNKLEKQGINIR